MWVALLTAIAALAVSLHGGWAGGNTIAVAPSTTPTATVDARAADRALCEAIGPLMRESVTIGKDFVALGHTDTPARDAGIPVFQAKVHNWIIRVQPLLDAAAPGFLARGTQRYIDDLQLYADNINPGEATAIDDLAWNDGTVAIGAAVTVCGALGITWWVG
jgi:hypothetical protein